MYILESMEEIYTEHVKQAYENAEAGISKITDAILAIDGMSGAKTRHFYNNLVAMAGARYLEIGSWKGSTVCSAMCNNRAQVLCIDNWSEFGGPKTEFLENFFRHRGKNNAMFLEHDCFTLNAGILPKFNIYMYDGNHDEESHFKALSHYIDNLDDVFIFVVDDWNCEHIRKGTRDAVAKLGLETVYAQEVRMTDDNSHTPLDKARAEWWNGIYFAVMKKAGVGA